MNILLIGEYYSENLGDPLLCQTVERVIKKEYPQAEVIPFDMSGKTGFTSYYPLENYSFVTKLFLKFSQVFPKLFLKNAFFRCYKKDEHRYLRVWCSLNKLLKEQSFDLVVFAGGSIFMDYFAGIIYMVVKRLNLAKTKIIFHACGMSRLDLDAEILLKRTLQQKNVVTVSLRDSYARFCKLFSTTAEVIDTFDTALGCSNYYPPAPACIADYGIGLMANDDFYEQQKVLIRQLLESGLSWKIFTNGAQYDFFYAKKILSDCGIVDSQKDDYIVARPQSSSDLIYTVTQFRNIISFRMHSQIVAASFGIPCFGFAWDWKIVELFRKLELPCNCSTHIVNLEEIQKVLGCTVNHIQDTALTQAEKSRLCLIQSISNALYK